MTSGHTPPDHGKPRIASTMGKARIFSESMPFIKSHRGKTVVIKYGGSAMVDEGLRNTFADDVAMLHYVGINVVIVHGGGPRISEAMHQRGVEPQWLEGLRVTDAETMRVVQATLAGEINPDIVKVPVVAVLATALPESEPMNALARAAVFAGPPRWPSA